MRGEPSCNTLYDTGITAIDQYKDDEVILEDLSEPQLNYFKLQATSRKNFAVLCMRKMFSEDERRCGNVAGQRGKLKLDPTGERLSKICSYVSAFYDVSEEDRMAVWRECRNAMDVANRNFRNNYYR